MSDRLAYMVDAHGDRLFGTFHVDHNKLLFAVFQRHVDRDIVNHRFFVVQLQSKRENVLAGLLLKAGDTEFRPVASEMILLRVPEKKYNELHQAFAAEVIAANMAARISEDSLIRKYISDPQPSSKYNPRDAGPEWSRVRFVRNFPALLDLVNHPSNGTSYLREPSRALDIGTIHSAAGNSEWTVFCQDDPVVQAARKE